MLFGAPVWKMKLVHTLTDEKYDNAIQHGNEKYSEMTVCIFKLNHVIQQGFLIVFYSIIYVGTIAILMCVIF
jgi:hypothetical protein